MRNHSILTTKAVAMLIASSFVMIIMLNGCGKSADDLYTEGKTLLLKEETFDKGIKSLVRFEKKFPEDPRTSEVMLALATSYQNRKNFNEASETFNRLINKYPDSAEAFKGMFLLGYMYYENIKDEKKASTILNEFIKMYPDSELAVSARVLMENVGLPIEEWSVVKDIKSSPEE